MNHSPNPNLYKYLFFILLIPLIIVITVLVTLQVTKNNNPTPTLYSVTPTLIPTPSPVITQVQKSLNIQQLETEIKKILSGDIVYKKSEYSELMSYVSKIDFPSNSVGEKNFGAPNSVNLKVYKYVAGQTIDTGYEGGSWTVSMDKWVHYLTEIVPDRTVTAKVVSMWHTGDNLIPIVAKKIGTKTFSVYDWFFKPGGTASRFFTTYDQTNKQIIEIEVRSYAQKFNMSETSALFEYTDNTEQYFDLIESSLNSAIN